ncbi:MAG: cation:proton antiporter [Hyphomicrobiaceae bacterium]|nr:cation:proton antiporter [Hyphomicrobiaceae bacterium]
MDHSIIVAIVLVLAAFVALEIGFSSALAEIMAGIALGFFFVDIHNLGWIDFLGNLGLLGLMFLAGFEVDINRLRGTWKASVSIGVASLLAPMAGVFVTCYFGLGLGFKASGLIAIGLSTTSLALVYHALKERGALGNDFGQVVLGAATVVDVLSMVLLALLLGNTGWGTAIFLLVILPTIFGLPRIGQWIFRRYAGSIVEFELRFLMVVLISMGFMAEHVGGIHPAVIAFAIGLVMAEVVEEHSEVEEKLRAIVFSLLAPVFFLSAGMQINLSLVTREVFVQLLLLGSLAIGLKFAGTAIAAQRLLGHSAVYMGLLFNYRLAFGIATATVGLESKVITPTQYSMILLVIVASAILPALFLRVAPNELDGPNPAARS